MYLNNVWIIAYIYICYVLSLSVVSNSATPWTVACQALLSMAILQVRILVGCHALFQGIFPIRGLNQGFLHCKQILYCLSHQGSPRILKSEAYLFSRGFSWPRNWTRVSCICRQILYQLSYQGSPYFSWSLTNNTVQTLFKIFCGLHLKVGFIRESWC